MPESIFSLKIFHGFNRTTVETIVNNCKTREFKSGELIIIEGEMSNGEGYILKKGQVAVSIKGQKIAELNAGDIFGEIALLNEEERTASISALTDIEVIVLNLDNLITIINDDQSNINKLIIERIEDNLKL